MLPERTYPPWVFTEQGSKVTESNLAEEINLITAGEFEAGFVKEVVFGVVLGAWLGCWCEAARQRSFK